MAWIATLTRRRAIDMIRSREASRRRESDQRLDPEPPDPVGETVVGDAERSAVSAALGSLSDLQRESLELAFYRGLTHTEIARRLGVPLGTVKTRIRAGLLSLASHMEAFSGE
jgi:RNA polymerase sigma-70 factor (ECF subfamily)